mmetsp:Transcript_24307/g.44623  ORF Transcript_24307/g.44623 Transcript_24307/m.44623 type:complete len:367 (-) Transcript_24307:61-1161(-)
MQRPVSEEPRCVSPMQIDWRESQFSRSAPSSRAGIAPPAPFSQRFSRAPRPVSKAKLAVSAWKSKVHAQLERTVENVADEDRWGHHYVRPASPSLVESCLYSSWGAPEPEMVCVKQAQSALEADLLSLQQKYGCEEPSSLAARYTIAVPRSSRPSTAGRSSSARSTPQRSSQARPSELCLEADKLNALPRYSKQTLAKWFKRIDIDRSGFLTVREFILALRLHRELFSIFASVYQVHIGDEGVFTPEQATQELQLIRRIVHDVDADRSGEVDWAEFCGFFDNNGLLLEYRVRTELNRTSLCEEYEASQAQADGTQNADAAAALLHVPSGRVVSSPPAGDRPQVQPTTPGGKPRRRRSSFGSRRLVA